MRKGIDIMDCGFKYYDVSDENFEVYINDHCKNCKYYYPEVGCMYAGSEKE